MASSFGKYQSGIEASTGNLVQASGQMAAQTVAVGVGFGQNIAQGLQAYNENSAKNDILTSEAEALAAQIQQYANMFGESPEHKAFADSLAPYIEKLSKVPSMSLTQKMGTVTSVKAGFANIGQQLQVFELMRGERMKRDMNVARSGVKEYDEVTVPTAIIQSGKMPYFHDKSYMENEAEITRLATEAKGRGANVDIAKVLSDWRAEFKASAMSRTDMPPEVKEALVTQLETGQKLQDNTLSQEDAAGFMMEGAHQSVKEQLTPAKVEAPATVDEISKTNAQSRALIQEGIAKLQAMGKKTETVSDAEFNKLVGEKAKSTGSRYTAVTALEEAGWSKSKDANGNQVWSRTTQDETIAKGIKIYQDELAKIPRDKKSDADEIKNIDAEIAKLQAKIDSGETLSKDEADKFAEGAGRLLLQGGDWLAKNSALNSARNINGKITPEVADAHIESVMGTNIGGAESLSRNLTNTITKALAYSPAGWLSKMIGGDLEKAIGARKLTVEETNNLKGAIERYQTKRNIEVEGNVENPEGIITALKARREQLSASIITGKKAPNAADIANAQAPKAEAQPEPSYTLTNQRNLSLGTTTAQIASSVESKRNDMKAFFTEKYGYIPASFEESFKAIYPEANFKTMETPYGAFMHDGKEWKQIQMQQPKVMSRKEMAEEKAVSFGKLQSDGSIDINEYAELTPNSGVFVRGIFGGSPSDASKFRTQMLEGSNAKRAVGRLIEINEMAGESMPWNAKLWGEAKALLPQIKAGLRIDIIGVGTVSNYEQQLIEEVVADPTKFWSLESSDRAKLQVIMDKISNKLIQEPANHGLDVKVGGRTNAQREKEIRMSALGSGKSKLQLDFEARGGKKGTSLDWKNKTTQLPDAFKKALTE